MPKMGGSPAYRSDLRRDQDIPKTLPTGLEGFPAKSGEKAPEQGTQTRVAAAWTA